MNKSFLTFILSIFIYAASAQGINFQGVARSANGTIIASSNISLRLSIISKNVDATPEYVETKTVVTNAQGIFSVVVGDATKVNITLPTGIEFEDGLENLKLSPDGKKIFFNAGPAASIGAFYAGSTDIYSCNIDGSSVTKIIDRSTSNSVKIRSAQ